MVNVFLWCLGISISWGLYIYLCLVLCAILGSLAYLGTPLGYKFALMEMIGSIELKPILLSAGFLLIVLLVSRVGGML